MGVMCFSIQSSLTYREHAIFVNKDYYNIIRTFLSDFFFELPAKLIWIFK